MNIGDPADLYAISHHYAGAGRWRYSAGVVAIVAGIVMLALILLIVAIAVVIVVTESGHHWKVPSDARPTGFNQLARWDSCGATGEYCSEVIVLGQNGTSFDDAIQPIQSRYEAKAWRIKSFGAGAFSGGGIVMSRPDDRTCIMLSRFSPETFRGDWNAPKPEELAARVSPYATVIEVSAGGCG